MIEAGIEAVYGVDFSGARRAGRTTWVARATPCGRGRRQLRLDWVRSAASLLGDESREAVTAGLVGLIGGSHAALWAVNFPFAFPPCVLPDGLPGGWGGQFAFLRSWGEDAYGAGVDCLRRARRKGLPQHVRRRTDREQRTPFDAYHYRIIYQTFYGMRDVLGPLRRAPGTAILPFQYRRLPGAERVVVESCPASTLKRLGLPHQNYKQPKGGPLTPRRRRTRRALLDGLPGLRPLEPTHRLRLMRDPGADGLDALISALGAWHCWRAGGHAEIARDPDYAREGKHYA